MHRMHASSRRRAVALTALSLFAASAASLENPLHAQGRENAAALVHDALAGDWRAQREAIATLGADFGGHAVDPLLRWIGSRADVEERTRAVYTLRQLGPDAVPAMVVALAHEDPMVRRNLALALATSDDPRAVPALVELARNDPDALTQRQAQEALERMGQGPRADAVALWIELARATLAGSPDVLPAPERRTAIFYFDGRGVAARAVTPEVYPAIQAAWAAERALRIAPGAEAAHAALVQAYERLDQALAVGGTEADPEFWEAQRAVVANVLRLAGRTPTGEEPPAAFPAPEAAPLAGAEHLLRGNDKRLRYKAALALALDHPSPEVVRTLGEALSESVVRQVLVIDGSPASLNATVAAIEGDAVVAYGARGGIAGLERAKTSPPKDAIVVRTNLEDLPADRLLGDLARDPRTRDVPVVLVVEPDRVDAAEQTYGGRVAAIVPAPATRAVLAAALGSAFAAAELNDQRMAAEEFSRRAAETLATLDAGALAPAADALVGAIGREDAVRLPALHALAKIGPAGAQTPATALLLDESASPEARLGAAEVLGAVLERHRAQPETLGALVQVLETGPAEMKAAAARALGRARDLAPEQRTRLLIAHGLDLAAQPDDDAAGGYAGGGDFDDES